MIPRDAVLLQAVLDAPFAGYARPRCRVPAADSDRALACAALLVVALVGGVLLGAPGRSRAPARPSRARRRRKAG